MRSIAVVTLCFSATAGAQTEDPTRAVDRVFFGLHAGAGLLSVREVTDSGGFSAEGVTPRPQGVVGYRMGIWPTDWLGLDLSLEAMTLAMGSVGGENFQGFGVRVSPALILAVPLRYVAPYAGAGPALLVPVFWSSLMGATSPGPSFSLRYFAGTNIYVTRDLRLFVELHFLPFDAELSREATKTRPEQRQRIGGAFAQNLVLGFAYTPDWLKESREKSLGIAVPALLVTLTAALLLGMSLGMSGGKVTLGRL